VSYEVRLGVVPLPLQRVEPLDPDATRPSGFASSSKLSKRKATENRVSVHLPLKGWTIGVAISPQEVTSGPLASLVLEYGLLKVRDASGSIQFELQVMKGSVDNLKYVDVNVSGPPFVWQGQLLRPPSENYDFRAADPDSPIHIGYCLQSSWVHIQTRYVSFFFLVALISFLHQRA
jgi:hypothetical protein